MEIGTSWPIGWSEEVTLNTSIDVIERAYQKSLDMLRWVTGKPTPTPPVGPASPPAGTPMTPKLIMAMFGKK